MDILVSSVKVISACHGLDFKERFTPVRGSLTVTPSSGTPTRP